MKKLLLLLSIVSTSINAYDITINNTTGYFVRIYIENYPDFATRLTCSSSAPNQGPGKGGLAPQTKDSWGASCVCLVLLLYPTFTKEGNLDWKTFDDRWDHAVSSRSISAFDATITASAGYKNFEIYAEKDANGIPQFHWR